MWDDSEEQQTARSEYLANRRYIITLKVLLSFGQGATEETYTKRFTYIFEPDRTMDDLRRVVSAHDHLGNVLRVEVSLADDDVWLD
jgi:hypothetical protein